MGKNKQRTIFLVGGGTGGHLFPLLSVADELTARGHKVRILTDKRGTTYFPDSLSFSYHVLSSSSPFVGGVLKRLLSFIYLFWGGLQSFLLILFYRPSAIIGFGGYPCFMPLLVGRLFNKPIAGHEQNVILGLVNRLVVVLGGRLSVSYSDTRKCSQKADVKVTGNPVRSEVLKYIESPYMMSSEGEKFNLLIVGGSQGASILSEIVPLAVAKLSLPLRRRLHIVQQCRKSDLSEALKIYSQLDMQVELREFFDDIPEHIAKAHLVISRSGASIVNEIVTIGRPAIFVPLSNYKVGDQVLNAERLVNHKAALSISQENFTVDALVKKLTHLIKMPEKLSKFATKAKSLRSIDGTAKIADFVESLIIKKKEK